MTSETSGHARRVWLLCAAIAVIGCGLNVESDAEGNDPRLLDRACRNNLCTFTGSAVMTEGITSDSLGFRIGPGKGTVNIELVVEPSSTHGPTLAILAAGEGTFYANSKPMTVTDDYQWIDVPPTPQEEGETVRLALEVRDGSTLDVVDIRSELYDWSHHGCSVSPSGPVTGKKVRLMQLIGALPQAK